MQRSKYDFWVGLFVMLGVASIVFLALKVGNLANLSFEKTYAFNAQFSNIGSIASGSPVKSAGLTVGQVRSVSLDSQTHQAVATIELESRYTFAQDSTLKIMTSGLLGEEYIAVVPGSDTTSIEQAAASSTFLVTRTQPSVSIGEILSQIMPGSDGDQPLMGKTYFVNARFTNLGTIKVDSAVKNAGVVVGRVRSVSIQPSTFEAVVSLELESKYNFPSDSSLRVMSSGLIGGQFVDISPGFEEDTLEEVTDEAFKKNGQYYTVTHTQSAMVLEDLIGQVLFSMTNKSGDAGEKK